MSHQKPSRSSHLLVLQRVSGSRLGLDRGRDLSRRSLWAERPLQIVAPECPATRKPTWSWRPEVGVQTLLLDIQHPRGPRTPPPFPGLGRNLPSLPCLTPPLRCILTAPPGAVPPGEAGKWRPSLPQPQRPKGSWGCDRRAEGGFSESAVSLQSSRSKTGGLHHVPLFKTRELMNKTISQC